MKILTNEEVELIRCEAEYEGRSTELYLLATLDHRTKERDRLMEAVKPIDLLDLALKLERSGYGVAADKIANLAATVKGIQKEEQKK